MIEICDLTKTRSGRTVLDGLSLALPDQGLVCVIGPSGCGKTTLANIIAGIDRDFSGSVRVMGTDLSELSPNELDRWRASAIGFVFQDFQLLEGLDARDNVLLAANLHGALETDAASGRAEKLLGDLGLGGILGRPVETLSGGEQQRVSIARALMWDAPVIVADEPTGSLDAENARGVMRALEDVARGRLVLMVTHDRSLLRHADIVVRIEDGRAVIERDSTPSATDMPGCGIDPVTERRTRDENAIGSIDQRRGGTRAPWKGPGGALSSIRRRMGRSLSIAALFALCGTLICAALAAGQAVDRAIDAFEQANVGFYSGFVEDAGDGLADRLKGDRRITAAWEQRAIGPIEIKIQDTSATIGRKVPLPRATEALSFGAMPRREKREIALSPSLARKFTADISSLVGTEARVSVGSEELALTVSGIYNAGYDDVFLSSDIEERLCAQGEGDATAVSFEVRNLSDVPDVHRELAADGVDVVDASETVSASLESFEKLRMTFSVVSGAVAIASLAGGIALTARAQAARASEFGLRRALGFTRRAVCGLCRRESLLTALASSILCALAVAALPLAPLPGGGLAPTTGQVVLGIACAMLGTLFAFELATAAAMRKPLERMLSSD